MSEVSQRILLVEPDAAMRESLKEMLRSCGYTVSPCQDAAAAREAMRSELHVAALCELAVETEDGDGIDFMAQLQREDPTLAALLMTADPDFEVAVRAMERGVDRLLLKPFDRASLSDKLASTLADRTRIAESRRLLGDLLRSRGELADRVNQQQGNLQRIETYLGQLLDAAPFSVLSTDAEGTVLTYNRTARELFGLQVRQVLGRSVSMLLEQLPEGDKPARTLAMGEHELRVPVLVHRRAVRDADGEIMARLLVVEDLREREAWEDQLIEADRLSTLGQLAPRIAHEFKVPMQLITGYTEVAMEALGRGDGERARTSLEQVPPAAGKVMEMVQQISDLGRPPEQTLQSLDLLDDVEALLASLQGLGAVKRCKVELLKPAALPRIQGDRSQIEQVLRNLIVNAADAMEIAPERVLSLRLGLSQDGRSVECEVSDTGEGMPPERLSKIFTPFYTTKPQGKGTGLGLAIAKAAIERHGGQIRVQSKPGRGTQFTVSLPLGAEQSTTIPEEGHDGGRR